MPFHRYKDPAYNLLGGSFPGTVGALAYDRVNVVSEGVGGGDGSANADDAKSAPSPNVGTYFVAFGEDATSSFANRGLRALAQNTDFLDDMVRGSVPGYKWGSVALSGQDRFQITDDVFANDVPSSMEEVIVLIEPATGAEPITSTGARLTPIGIYDAGDTTSEQGNGFVTNPWIRLSAFYTGTIVYYYGVRTSQAYTLETPLRNLMWSMGIRGAYAATRARAQARHGLNERYRRGVGIATSYPSDLSTDTPGAGAVIHRDGRALEVRDVDQDLSLNRPDPFLALYRATKADVAPASTADDSKAGAIGFLATQTLIQSGEAGDEGVNYAEFASMLLRNCDSDDVGGTDQTFTRVPKGASATGNPGGAGTSTIELDSPAYFWRDFSGQKRTTIRKFYDLLLVERSSGAFHLMQINNIDGSVPERCNVSQITPTLDNPNFSVDESINVTLVQPSFYTRSGKDKPFTFFGRTYNSTDDDTVYSGGAEFVAGSIYRRHSFPTSDGQAFWALRWGGHNEEDADVEWYGYLYGDGRLTCRSVQANLHSKIGPAVLQVTGAGPHTRDINLYYVGDYSQNPTELYPYLKINAGSTGDVTINLNFYENAGFLQGGERCGFYLRNESDDLDSITINWGGDASFKFSGDDGQIPNYQTGIYKWEGTYSPASISPAAFLMTRTDYDL